MSDICYRRARTASDTCKVLEAAEAAAIDKLHLTHDGRDFVIILKTLNVEQRSKFDAECRALCV